MITITQFILAAIIITGFSVTTTLACAFAVSGRISKEEGHRQ